MSRVKARVRTRIRRPPDLTSLFDVLFIVVFVALIRAAAAEHAAAAPKSDEPNPVTPATPQPPQLSLDLAALQKRALAALEADLAARSPVAIRISATNRIVAIEGDGKVLKLDTPLLEQNVDRKVRQQYLGERSDDLHLCAIAAVRLGVDDLSHHIVIILPATPRAERLFPMNKGLDADVARCLLEQRGQAAIVEPTEAAPP